ncbi:SDR family NAD(P)-dependent oxidoreductase [Marinococcus sp. PL1-022]|uniref:SDR family NAD(P)-dependent oxidoreductase n=1 Tax=Marinococcus sp. PL1-022 TaxID=3095363 RepID=UPI0029C3E1F0|nr:SDR family NAD(P)-dependent oxidoreductase [Marinococcus sp. PL1-022]MDX6154532.1 SDR family NAD(P)-dependent oxidoreductase [Marinococcus sp. PL1-022]
MAEQHTAIVTGGASGLGRAVTLKLAEQGVNVSIVDISEEAGNDVVQEVESHGASAIFVKADVTKPDEVKNYVDKTVEAFGAVTMFFNNAGISGSGKKFLEHSIEDIDQVLNINLHGMLYGIKYVVEAMIKNGGGSIVNTSSSAGLVGQVGVGTYSATKHATIGITKTIVAEYASEGIRANAVAPGATETPMVEEYMKNNPQAKEVAIDPVPQKRLGTAEEVAELVAFLLGDKANYINGAVVPIDGGFTAV